MYLPELEIKDTKERNTSAIYFDLLLSISRDGQLQTSIYDKRYDFHFHISNFPFLYYYTCLRTTFLLPLHFGW